MRFQIKEQHHVVDRIILHPLQNIHVLIPQIETVACFIILGYKITADGDYSHEIKRHLFFGRKVRQHINLDSILKNRDVTLPTKVRLVKTMVFSSSHVWM